METLDEKRKRILGYKKKWRDKNRNRILFERREWRKSNKEFLQKYYQIYREKNRDQIRINNRKYDRRIGNRKKLEKIRTNENYRIAGNLRTRLNIALRNQGGVKKTRHLTDLLGIDYCGFKKYIESLFQEGMTWGNYSRTGWHIDHKLPLISFDLSNKDELSRACHYKNLQPLWASDNLSKGAKII